MEILEAAQQLKVELRRHVPNAATPSKSKQASSLAGENLRDYFRLVADSNLRIPWALEDLVLYSESDIDAGQIGYRWYAKDDGSSNVLDDDWNATWLVLGQLDGDPIILDQEMGVVMMAEHGMGEWAPEIVASSVADFVGILAVWVQVAIGEFQGKFRNKSTSILEPELIERLAEKLQFIPQPFRDNFLNTLN